MKQVYTTIIPFRGSHYDFGFRQGELLKDSYTIQNRERQWNVRRPRFVIDIREAKRAITRFAPGIWDELIGIGDALKWPMEKVLKEFGGYRLNYVKSGCSIVTGDNFLVRNYDYHPKTYEGRYVFFQPDDGGYAIAGPSQRITGRTDGINEKGLVLGYNFMHRKKPGIGFICAMIARLVLESCQDVEEAVGMLREIPHRHSFSYIVYDQSGRTFVTEASPRGVEVRESSICTNHFEVMKKENRNYLTDSYRRSEVMARKQKQLSGAAETFELLNNKENGVFSTQYRNWAGTIHTSAYFPDELKTWMALGSQKPHEFDFAAWLAGEELDTDRLTGELETDLPFVHMNENAVWMKQDR